MGKKESDLFFTKILPGFEAAYYPPEWVTIEGEKQSGDVREK